MSGRSDAGPLDVLVVASWFPSADAPATGRFVADQVEALAATNGVHPRVVTFDPALLTGGRGSRLIQEAAVEAATRASLGSGASPFLDPACGVAPGIDVCRLVVAEGTTSTAGPVHAAEHRAVALRAFSDRLAHAGSATGRGIVHAHTIHPDGVAAAALAERLGWPLILTEHSSFVPKIVAEPAVRDRYVEAMRRAARVIAVSESLAAELRRLFPEEADRIVVIPNAVPLGAFEPAGYEGRTPDELLFVGALKRTKGIDTLLSAVAEARRARPSITLRLIGRAPDAATAERWRARIAELGLDGVVTLAGGGDRAAVAAAMRGASIFVHPSPRETFGVVAVEALAAGLPLVAADSGGVTEIMGNDPQRLGTLVPPDDPAALARGILDVLERRGSFDAAALRASVAGFDAPTVADRLLGEYRAAIDAASGPAMHVGAGAGHDARRRDRDQPIVVVALDRERAAQRIGALAEEVRASLSVVTSAGSVDLRAGRVVEIALLGRDGRPSQRVAPHGADARRAGNPTAARLRRILADPVGGLRRALGRDPADAAVLASVATAIATIARDADPATPIELVALDGRNHVAVAAAIRSGSGVRYPGGLRRLADERHGPGAGA